MAWVAEDTFDSYSDGDLSGNSGGSGWSAAWSGDADYDVEGTVVYQGPKAVIGTNANGSISRTLTAAVTSGVVYFAMRMSTHGASTGDGAILFHINATDRAFLVQFRGDTDNVVVTDGAGTVDLITGFNAGVFYLFEATLNGDSTYDIRYHDGSTWSSPLTGLDYANSGSIDRVIFNSGSDQTIFYDYISGTNPFDRKTLRTLLGVGI